MTAATSQPSSPITVSSTYSGSVAGGWVGYDYSNNKVGTATLTPTSEFTTIQSRTTFPDGSVALAANSATDALSASTMTIGTQPVKNNFTVVGVIRVNNTSGAGVGMRSNTDTILLWRNAGNYSVRVNGVTISGGAFPLGTVLNYVLTSNASGIYLCVNGVDILSGAASAAATSTGNNVDVYEDSVYGGGAMDMEVAMMTVLSSGVDHTTALSLSNNPWQIFDVASAAIHNHKRGTHRGKR